MSASDAKRICKITKYFVGMSYIYKTDDISWKQLSKEQKIANGLRIIPNVVWPKWLIQNTRYWWDYIMQFEVLKGREGHFCLFASEYIVGVSDVRS